MKRALIALSLLALVGSVATAGRLKFSEYVEIPGVDETGMIDPGLVGVGLGKATVNTKNGKFRGTVRGTAPNLSGKNARFKATSEVASELSAAFPDVPFDPETVKRAVYRVNKKGKAHGVVTGKVDPSDFAA